jgi:hypothetical protein
VTKEELLNFGLDEETAQKVADALAKQTPVTDGLNAEIARLNSALADKDAAHAEEISRLKLDAAVEKALSGAKARNIRAVKALLELDKAELADDGTVKGLTDQIKKLQGTDGYLFDGKPAKPAVRGALPAQGGDTDPGGQADISKMTYEELAAYMAENPDIKI